MRMNTQSRFMVNPFLVRYCIALPGPLLFPRLLPGLSECYISQGAPPCQAKSRHAGATFREVRNPGSATGTIVRRSHPAIGERTPTPSTSG
jgi:hypothetical protein